MAVFHQRGKKKMQCRTLFFASILLPWILSAAAHPKPTKRLEQPVVNSPGDELLRDTDTTVPPKAIEMPTCLLCVCLTGSVYCEEVFPEMSTVPVLPRETGYLYARFNKIRKIRNKDFADIVTLRRIDLSGNLIAEIDDGAFARLHNLEELILAENRLTKLPMLPTKLVLFNANFNELKTSGVKATAFKKLTKLAYLYLGNNELISVPQLPESLHVVHLQNNRISAITDQTFCKGNTSYYVRTKMDEVRLDGNPVVLANYPYSFICLKTLPLGWYN